MKYNIVPYPSAYCLRFMLPNPLSRAVDYLPKYFLLILFEVLCNNISSADIWLELVANC